MGGNYPPYFFFFYQRPYSVVHGSQGACCFYQRPYFFFFYQCPYSVVHGSQGQRQGRGTPRHVFCIDCVM